MSVSNITCAIAQLNVVINHMDSDPEGAAASIRSMMAELITARDWLVCPMLDDVMCFKKTGEWSGSDLPPNHEDREEVEWAEANLISSQIFQIPTPKWPPDRQHIILLDLDQKAVNIWPSSTEGSFHVAIHHPVEWRDLEAFYGACAKVGLLQDGYVDCALDRKAAFLRRPGFTKEDTT